MSNWWATGPLLTDNYWWLLTTIDDYWRLLTTIDDYWWTTNDDYWLLTIDFGLWSRKYGRTYGRTYGQTMLVVKLLSRLKNSMWEWNRAHQESKCRNCRKSKKIKDLYIFYSIHWFYTCRCNSNSVLMAATDCRFSWRFHGERSCP